MIRLVAIVALPWSRVDRIVSTREVENTGLEYWIQCLRTPPYVAFFCYVLLRCRTGTDEVRGKWMPLGGVQGSLALLIR